MNFRMAFSAQNHQIGWKFVKHAQIIKVMDLRCWLFAPLAKSFGATEGRDATFAPKGAAKIS
jgi:hypothetical protein